MGNDISKTSSDRGKLSTDERVDKLEKRLNNLLQGKTELEVKSVKNLSVSPKSKLRVACE